MGCSSRSRAARGGWTPPTPAEVSPEPLALPEMFGGCRNKADGKYKEQIYFYLKICNSFMMCTRAQLDALPEVLQRLVDFPAVPGT